MAFSKVGKVKREQPDSAFLSGCSSRVLRGNGVFVDIFLVPLQIEDAIKDLRFTIIRLLEWFEKSGYI